MVSEIEISLPRSDLIFLQRVLDTAFSEIEAAVADGDVDESVLIDLDEALGVLKDYLGRKE